MSSFDIPHDHGLMVQSKHPLSRHSGAKPAPTHHNDEPEAEPPDGDGLGHISIVICGHVHSGVGTNTG